MSSRFADDLRLAHVLADAVDQLTMSRFKAQDLEVTTKPDLTEVTDADRAAEQLVRSQLSRSRSRDQVIGEEFGSTGSSNRQWVIDPIDGTSNFVRGVPVWGTLIGLIEDGQPVVGLVSAPSLSRRWWGGAGAGAWTGSRISSASRLQVSQVDSIEDASLSYSSLHGWADAERLPQMLNLMQRFWRTRAYGDFWSYMLVAEGAVDVACEPELNLHDMVALAPIVTEAGGRFTSIDGEDGPFGGSAVATNGILHDEVLEAIAASDDRD
ncbi:histidinol-phosphatase [Brachybacterium muris]|uniref:histidinol-phosphatase n=1 Tax=Brachybacterium muris TaxID=219301 RepID=UPI0021A2C703|nr:histidinol-phosphatase [Brachybacterium muris]MCT1430870.1 histidinol-phosphatase [Brachybacterium muris]MCT1999039.1 histidinol-phosphatase [Brachybacterium muris]